MLLECLKNRMDTGFPAEKQIRGKAVGGADSCPRDARYLR